MADIVQTVADVSLTSGRTASGTTGTVDITAGMPLTEDTTNEVMELAANTSTTLAAVAGIALHGSLIGQPVTWAVDGAVVDVGATLTEGTTYVLSIAGKISPVADVGSGDVVTILGVGNSDGELILKINNSGATVP